MPGLSNIANWLDPTPAVSPVNWIRESGGFVWSKQEEILESVVKNRYTAVQSCHGTGKSHISAEMVCWWISQHPIGEAFVVTSAPTSPQIEAILWRYISAIHEERGLPGRITWGQVPAWKIGDRMVAFGRKPADYTDPTKAMQAFQGIHARYVLIVLDEACGIPKWLWDAARTLVTNDNSRILAIGNPDDPASEFEKKCRPDSNYNVIQVGYRDLPAYTGERVPPELNEELTGKTWVEEAKQEWGIGSPLWMSKVEGQFPDVTDDTLIMPSWIRMAVEKQMESIGVGVMGGDVARMGPDETCAYLNRSGKIRLVYSAFKQDTTKTQDGFRRVILETGAPMWIDIDGVGAGPYDNLRREGKRVFPFQNGAQAYQPDRFRDRRAEEYWELRKEFEDNLIDLDPQDLKLQNQLQSIKYDLTSRGIIFVESKDDMKKRGHKSPDRADAVMMSRRRAAYVPPPEAVGAGSVEDLTGDLLGRPM